MRLCSWIAASLIYSSFGFAQPSLVPDPAYCFAQIESHFFSPNLVNQGLSLYEVRQELWLPINQSLQKRKLNISRMMKSRTAWTVPNPFELSKQREATAKLLKTVLYEVFEEAMRENYVTGGVVEKVFNYIFSEQFPYFIQCFGPFAPQLDPRF